MIAYVTSVGEPTTNLCRWALHRNGFDVRLLDNPNNTLAEKLDFIYKDADDDFLRVDADVIVNRFMTPELLEQLAKENEEIWWWQFQTFDWFMQERNNTMAFIRKPALTHLRSNIKLFMRSLRPETEVSRIKELHNPRRMETYDYKIMGIHGYGIKDIKPVIRLKHSRGQSHLYDFEMAEQLNKLGRGK